MSQNVTARFSDRVKDYILYRQGYPLEILEFLKTECGLQTDSVIADIGSGTGKSAEMFLENGDRVFAIEPNDEMRYAAEATYGGRQNFLSINAAAEHTSLDNYSVDFIIAGQAFHWFRAAEAKAEFKRILKPGGFVVLIWNERPMGQAGFMGDYDAFLVKYSTDYTEIDHRNIDYKVIEAFYAPDTFAEADFRNKQIFDLEGLKGRYNSCSYALPENSNGYPDAERALHDLFNEYQRDGKVVMEYVTKLYWGNLGN